MRRTLGVLGIGALCVVIGTAPALNYVPLLLAAGAFALLVGFLLGTTTQRIAWPIVGALVVAAEQTPRVAGFGGASIYATDLLLTLLVAVAFLRGRPARQSALYGSGLFLVGWGILRTGLSPDTVSYVRLVLPILAAMAFVRLPGITDDLWRVLRWVAVAAMISGALNISGGRWRGFVGGPAELGAISGAVLVLASTQVQRYRLRWTAVGVVGLIGSASVASLIGTVVALLAVSRYRDSRRKSLRFAIGFVTVVGVVVLPFLREDLWRTTTVHTTQASLVRDVFRLVNPIIGGGWGTSFSVARELDTVSYLGLHNFYLDWLANLGLIGVGLLGYFLFTVYRTADRPTRAVLILVVVTLNTSGAFPSTVVGLLGIAVLQALGSSKAPATTTAAAPQGADARVVG